MIIKKNIETDFELTVTCRRCEKAMIHTAAISDEYLYFTCPECESVVVVDIRVE